ncbi:MAG TPA: apolipoprotein N-acyltransferase, partial [bacterium]|nr:apolipoprotein N-acyltransferase [bacterium]
CAILWFVFHKIYSLTSLGTSGIEAPFYGSLALMQLAAFGGFGTLSSLFIGFSAGIAAFWKERNLSNGIWTLLFAALLFGAYFWGEGRLKMEDRLNFRVALIQHNLPISGKWNFENPEGIRKKYRELALEASKGKPSLIVFPLYNFPGDPSRKPDFFTALAREIGSHILIAAYIPEKEGGNISKGFYDTAILYSPDGKIAGEYQAVQSPPFRQIFEKTGKEYHLLETPFGKIGVLLCYEDSSPRLARMAVEKGADILIALSNPGHFTSTHLPYYHLMQDRLRAIETRRFVARVSANGYSAIIDPRGKVLKKSALNEEIIEAV